MAKYECKGCHKTFDFDKYYGICPKCGTFNQKGEKKEEQPKTPVEKVKRRKVRKGRKDRDFVPILWLLVCLIVTVGVVAYKLVIHFQTEEFIKSVNYETITLQPEEVIPLDEGDYKIKRVVEIVPANVEEILPEDEKLIGVEVAFTPNVEAPEHIIVEQPYIEYMDGFHKECLPTYDVLPFVSKYGLEEEDLIRVYDSLPTEKATDDFRGYYIYSVNKDTERITVTLELKKEYRELRAIDGFYQMTLPIERTEENADE